MAASQRNKRWASVKWAALGTVMGEDLGERIYLFPGKSRAEVQEARSVERALGKQHSELIVRQPLSAVATRIGRLKCFLSNDTGLLHIGAAAAIPTFGLYVSTDPKVWAPLKAIMFGAFENRFFKENCPARKLYSGNCYHYYTQCPAIEEHGDDIAPLEVFHAIKKLI